MKIYLNNDYANNPNYVAFIKENCLNVFNSLYIKDSMVVIEQYININMFNEYRKNENIKDICTYIIENLSVYRDNDSAALWINPNDYYKDTTVTLEQLYNVITYGTMSINENPIFLYMSQIITDKMPDLYMEYSNKGGL